MRRAKHSKEAHCEIRASRIQREARSFYGREISAQRAFEISIEIERYQQAIASLHSLLNFDAEPCLFLEALARLGGDLD